jgi:predicted Zn-dependent protease
MFKLSTGITALLLIVSTVQCSQKNSTSPSSAPTEKKPDLANHTEAVPTQVPPAAVEPTSVDSALLKKIEEKVPENPFLIKMEKSFWLGKKIWVTLGVERSSVTGLAMSVVGYIPAEIEKVGMQLVLKRQNYGLYGGSTLAPELPLNSYPIISETEKEILVDLSQPQTSYGMSAMGFVLERDSRSEIETRLAYVKNIEIKNNTLSFNTVLTGRSPVALFESEDGSIESETMQDPYLISLTLRQDWIIEESDPNFKPVPSSRVRQGFFLENPFVENKSKTLEIKQFVSHIDFTKPFTWTLSHNTPENYKEAVTEGILAWNKTMAQEFLEVDLGKEGDAFTDPQRSNMVWDDNLAIGMAFANWRSNPYTGQILQAQVYMSGKMWAENAKDVFKLRKIEENIRNLYKKQAPVEKPVNPPEPDAPIMAQGSIKEIEKEIQSLRLELKQKFNQTKISSRSRRFTIGFNGSHAIEAAQSKNYCFKTNEHITEMLSVLKNMEFDLGKIAYDQSPHQGEPIHYTSSLPQEFHSPYVDKSITEQKFSENVVRAVVMHEIGHTLGLRHNFMASTQTSDKGRIQSASIMDYNDLVVDAQFDQPGDADTWILSQVYPVKNFQNVKPMRFCTDENVREKVTNCSMHDSGASTLDSHATQIETHLLLAHFYMSVGHPRAFRALRRAISSTLPLARDILTSTEAGTNMFGADFRTQQQRAFKFLNDYKNFMGLDFMGLPENLFRDAGVSVIVANANRSSSESELFKDVVLDLEKVLINEQKVDPENRSNTREADYGLELRRISLLALQKFQSPLAREAIKRSQTILMVRNEKSVEDEELLLNINKLFSEGYYQLEE